MLVLGRRKNESIMIGEDVEIIVVDVNRGKVRLGIIADRKIPVHRKEVYWAISKKSQNNG